MLDYVSTQASAAGENGISARVLRALSLPMLYSVINLPALSVHIKVHEKQEQVGIMGGLQEQAPTGGITWMKRSTSFAREDRTSEETSEEMDLDEQSDTMWTLTWLLQLNGEWLSGLLLFFLLLQDYSAEFEQKF